MVFFAADGYEGRPDAGLGGMFGHILAANVELVGRDEFVEGGIPARAGIFFDGEKNIAPAGGNSKRVGPRRDFGLLERLNHPADGKVVCVAGGRVGGIDLQGARGGAGFHQQSREGLGRLVFSLVEGGFEALRQVAPGQGGGKIWATLGNGGVLGAPRRQKQYNRNG